MRRFGVLMDKRHVDSDLPSTVYSAAEQKRGLRLQLFASFWPQSAQKIRSGCAVSLAPAFITVSCILWLSTVLSWDAKLYVSTSSPLTQPSVENSIQLLNSSIHDTVYASDVAADAAASSRRNIQWQNATTLIVVAGHAIYTGPSWDPQQLRNEDNWYLEPYQSGQVATFLEHVRRGVELAANDSAAILLFSGGQTRPGVGPRSEASSYWLAANAFGWFGFREAGVQERTHVEEFARDSLENLLFSICRFRQLAGRFPERIKVVSFGFKRARFEMLHRRAVRFPLSNFDFIGIDPPGTEDIQESLSARERSQVMGPFAVDLYGCNSVPLFNKRLDRNPFIRFHPYPQGCPELGGLFRHCGSEVYQGRLPWDEGSNPDTPT